MKPDGNGRRAAAPLRKDDIVKGAIAIADAEGLSSVSLRKLGSALGFVPMRFYTHLSSKEELLELMIEAVYGEMAVAGPFRGEWREALWSMAYRTRQAVRDHKWFFELQGGRRHLGPNALAHLERSLGALSHTPGFEDIDAVIQAVGTVNAYVIGVIQGEANELWAQSHSRVEWQTAASRMMATGQFPTIARVVQDATQVPFDVVFDGGLNYVLDGIAARLAR